jgi:hypothetical protein
MPRVNGANNGTEKNSMRNNSPHVKQPTGRAPGPLATADCRRRKRRSLERLRERRRHAVQPVAYGTPGKPGGASMISPAPLAAFLAAQEGPLYILAACARLLPEAEDVVLRRGAEYLAVTVSVNGCCGQDFVMVATINLCDEPGCRQDHRATPRQLREVVSLAAAHPQRVRTSPGWAGALRPPEGAGGAGGVG